MPTMLRNRPLEFRCVMRKPIQKVKVRSHKRLGDSRIHERVHDLSSGTAILWLHAPRNLLRCVSSTLHRERGGLTRRRHFHVILVMHLSHCGASGDITCSRQSQEDVTVSKGSVRAHPEWKRRGLEGKEPGHPADLSLLGNSRQCRPPAHSRCKRAILEE